MGPKPMKGSEPTKRTPSSDGDLAAELDMFGDSSVHGPFGETPRLPLVLCFLLPDGRFQPFNALWLELMFKTDSELEQWERELQNACQASAATTLPKGVLVGPTRLSPAPKMPEPSTPPTEAADPGPIDVFESDDRIVDERPLRGLLTEELCQELDE